VRRTYPLSFLLALSLACAPDIDVDPGEGVDDLPPADGPTVEFDPAASVIPFPNNLVLDRETGTLDLPEQCNESPAQTAIRTLVLNALDGFGTFKPALTVTFTEAVAADSLEGRVLLFRRATGAEPADPAAAEPVPAVVFPSVTQRFAADCSEAAIVNNAIIVPLVPLDGSSTYVVALTDGITTEDGTPFIPSLTWALVRQSENPVTVENGVVVAERTPFDPAVDAERLLGLDLLWNAHAGALAFLDAATDVARGDILIAWEFNTQTTTAPLDSTVDGSLAAEAPTDPLLGVASIVPDGETPQEFIAAQLGIANCSPLNCDSVGDVVGGALIAPSYQIELPNPLADGDPVKGPWSDPISPASIGDETITIVAFIPEAAPPAEGYPTVVFGHGLTRSQGDLFAIGSQLADQGIASVAVNWVAHGNRAVQISDDPLQGCDGDPDPTDAPQCFSPILSADLPATRDSIRQSALDVLTLVEALKACGTANCGDLQVDANRLGYMGQSLGALIGTLVVAMSPDIQTAVLNVGGVGLIDVLEHTDSVQIRCSLVDALIAAGVIEGEPLDPVEGTGTCLGEEWKTQPGYLAFANVARWVLDPADGANYLARFGARPILIQEVIGDAVVPNFVTNQMGALRGLSPEAAGPSVDPATPSEPIAGATAPLWVTYETLPANGGTGFPGNTYSHGSLLAPASAGLDGQIATGQMQADAITYLLTNLQ
jgi:dienelactone hydrolase